MSHRFLEHANCVKGNERIISYLPLGHIAPQLLDVFVMIASAGACWFAQPNAMKVREGREGRGRGRGRGSCEEND